MEAFKRWVKKIINKVKSFFTRGKKKDSKEEDTTGNDDNGKKNAPTPEEAKKVVEDMNEVLKTANNVDSELKKASSKASSDENVIKEEADTVTKKADDVSKQMSEFKSRVETTYLALPQKTEAGIAEGKKRKEVEKYREELAEKAKIASSDDYSENADKQTRAMATDMTEKNFFKLKNNNEAVRGIVDNFIVRVGEIETGKQVVFAYRTRIDTCASHILDVLRFSFKNVDGVRAMLRYMNQRIPRQLQEYIGKNTNKVNSLNKEISRVGTKKDPEYEFISDDIKSNPDRAERFNNSR